MQSDENGRLVDSIFQGEWALPGGFVDEYESLPVAAARELSEETSVNPADVKLLQVDDSTLAHYPAYCNSN